MGCGNSKSEKIDALALCRARKRFIKQAIESRYLLSASHLAYTQSLHSLGLALRQFAEAEVVADSVLSASAVNADKTPSHSSYPSPSPSHNAELVDSPVREEFHTPPPVATTVSYMRSEGPTAVTVRINPSFGHFADDDALCFPVRPPPPPPYLDADSSWDFFSPVGSLDGAFNANFDNLMNPNRFREYGLDGFDDEAKQCQKVDIEKPEIYHQAGRHLGNAIDNVGGSSANSSIVVRANSVDKARTNPKEEIMPKDEICAHKEIPPEFITHRAKDFLSSMKDIEHRFFRASESGREVSRMLEANRIQPSCFEPIARSHLSLFCSVCPVTCCNGESAYFQGTPNGTKTISLLRSMSYQSSSSRNPLTSAMKDDADDSGSDFIEEFCMISGSHSSTLDRLFAWERKLCDEVKASERIQVAYNTKCNLLRLQFAKDFKAHQIDKTRAAVKDLHSQLRVAIQAADSISKRIEKLRDEELLPQLLELVQGLIRMWRSMLECHHSQYITITLAYRAKTSKASIKNNSTHEVLLQLQQEITTFDSSFSCWFEAFKSYIEDLNGWLQHCIIQPQERRKRAFSPRRSIAPPIFVLCRDWSTSIQALPYKELSEGMRSLLPELSGMRVEAMKKEKRKDLDCGGEARSVEENEKCDKAFALLQSSLTRAFDCLTKFAEASLKMYEDVRKGTEAAQLAYTNCKTR